MLLKNPSFSIQTPEIRFQLLNIELSKPLNEIKAGEKTKESDLAILCANCHRAVHRLETEDPWNELLSIHGKL